MLNNCGFAHSRNRLSVFTNKELWLSLYVHFREVDSRADQIHAGARNVHEIVKPTWRFYHWKSRHSRMYSQNLDSAVTIVNIFLKKEEISFIKQIVGYFDRLMTCNRRN